MDKLDDMIKHAQTTYQPKDNFVEETMQQIVAQQNPKRSGLRIWIPVLAGGLVVLALVFIAMPGLTTRHKTALKQTANSGSTTSSATTTASLTPGTDDTSLASDLSTIQSSQNQENTDQSNADNTLNDSSQQITVPTD